MFKTDIVQHSARSCRQICVWADRTAEDACSAAGRPGTVSTFTSPDGRKCKVDKFSFYEGHNMDVVTFATRVCKLLGVETMIGMLGVTTSDDNRPNILRSHERCRGTKPDVPRWRHRLPQRCECYPNRPSFTTDKTSICSWPVSLVSTHSEDRTSMSLVFASHHYQMRTTST
jgi:hypothetical protein